jgi:hypothetical protein
MERLEVQVLPAVPGVPPAIGDSRYNGEIPYVTVPIMLFPVHADDPSYFILERRLNHMLAQICVSHLVVKK